MPTASSLERAARCPQSFVLPQILTTSEDGDRGKAIHLYCAKVLSGIPKADALAGVEDEAQRATCDGIDFRPIVGDLNAGSVRPECAYTFDVALRTVRFLGSMIDRQYERNDFEIAGTNDVEGVRYSGIPVVADWKTGFEDVTTPATSMQMRFHAVVMAKLKGATAVDARILRIGESGAVKSIEHTFTMFELEQAEDELVDIFHGVREAHEKKAAGAELTVNPGSHCRYCAAKPACPKFTLLAGRIADQTSELAELTAKIRTLSNDEAWHVKEVLKQVYTVAEAVDKGLKEWAKHSAILSPDGTKKYGVVSYPKENFSKELALSLLRSKSRELAEAKGETFDEPAHEAELRGLYWTKQIDAVREMNVKSAPRPRKKKDDAI